MRTRHLLTLAALGLAVLAACKDPVAPHDPYATILVQSNYDTAGRLNVPWQVSMILRSEGNIVVANGAILPTDNNGRVRCQSLGGFVGARLIQMVVVADTINGQPPDSMQARLARGDTTWPGIVRFVTDTFDPLVSSMGHGSTQDAPIFWHWTLADSARVLAEDASTPCTI